MHILDHKKRLLVLFASPNPHGSTRLLLDSFLECFKSQAEWEIDEMDVYSLNPRPCMGCGYCAKKDACQFPDLEGFDKALRRSDLLAVASPVYNASFPAPMKALLDRCQRYFEARFSLGQKHPIRKHRKAVLLLAMGREEEFPVEVTAYQLERTFSVMNTELCGCAVWGGTDLGRQNLGAAQQKARGLGLEILSGM